MFVHELSEADRLEEARLWVHHAPPDRHHLGYWRFLSLGFLGFLGLEVLGFLRFLGFLSSGHLEISGVSRT